jgi:uncharacterized damage-inducible protein DinB
MSLNRSLIAELQQEAANTRKMLERVPTEKNDWQPHNKSMKMGRLATHIAELSGWTTMIMETDELNFANFDYKPVMAATSEELLAKHDESLAQAIASLEKMTDADFDKMWTMRNGDHVHFVLPKKAVLRSWAYSHLYHHRGQLSVYLRMLDIPVPGMYGPSADEVPSAPVAEVSAN